MSINAFVSATLATCIVCIAANDADAASNRLFEFLPAPYLSPVAPASANETPEASFNDRFAFSQAPAGRDYLVDPVYRAALPPLTTASLPRERKAQKIVAAARPIVGIASTYNPHDPTDLDAGNEELASGERYDPNGWTAAIRTDLRKQFGGVRFGKNYVPAFVLVQSNDKQIIVRINDVGPLKRGRIIDLNRRAMQYFDPTMQVGLIPDVRVTLLAGEEWALGPVEEDRPVSVAAVSSGGR